VGCIFSLMDRIEWTSELRVKVLIGVDFAWVDERAQTLTVFWESAVT
jgi:hypothetical protein